MRDNTECNFTTSSFSNRYRRNQPEVINLGKHFNSFRNIVSQTIGESIKTEVMAGEDIWNIRIDIVQIKNAVLNLILNAGDAMNGIGTLTIEVDNAFIDEDYASEHLNLSAGEYVMLGITDTGSGMSAEIAAQVFEPFFSTKPHSTGLGLSMVYGFVKQSGGHITVDSEIDHGTSIKIYLPRCCEVEDVIALKLDHV